MALEEDSAAWASASEACAPAVLVAAGPVADSSGSSVLSCFAASGASVIVPEAVCVESGSVFFSVV